MSGCLSSKRWASGHKPGGFGRNRRSFQFMRAANFLSIASALQELEGLVGSKRLYVAPLALVQSLQCLSYGYHPACAVSVDSTLRNGQW